MFHQMCLRPYPFNEALFTTSEIESLAKIVAEFRSKTATQIVKISHREKAWLENEAKREIINYQRYAFDLRAV